MTEAAATSDITERYLAAQARAQARLIDAAPDLLAALQLAYEEIHHPGSARHSGVDIDERIQAAISKAAGR